MSAANRRFTRSLNLLSLSGRARRSNRRRNRVDYRRSHCQLAGTLHQGNANFNICNVAGKYCVKRVTVYRHLDELSLGLWPGRSGNGALLIIVGYGKWNGTQLTVGA